jgi:hypothetical protein
MKDGTLRSLRLQGQPLDERDWKIIGNFLRVTTSLKELDLTYTHGSLEQLGEAIKQNKSLTKLTVTQIVQDHNMPQLIEVLKGNPGITQLNMNNCYMQAQGIGQLSRFLKSHPTITHLSLDGINFEELNPGFDRGMGLPKLANLVKVLQDSPNMLDFSPATTETETICAANKAAVDALLKTSVETPEALTGKEILDISNRLPAFVHTAEMKVRKPELIAQLLVNIEDAAAVAGVAFEMPSRYVDKAAALPRPFRPSGTPVDFAAVTNPVDLAKPESAPRLYQAVEAGQTDELLACMKSLGVKMSADIASLPRS